MSLPIDSAILLAGLELLAVAAHVAVIGAVLLARRRDPSATIAWILFILLAPFIGASTASDWTVGLITLVGTVVAMPLVQPVLENIFQDWLADQIRALFGRKKENRSSRKK